MSDSYAGGPNWERGAAPPEQAQCCCNVSWLDLDISDCPIHGPKAPPQPASDGALREIASDILSRLVQYKHSKYEPLYEQDRDYLERALAFHDQKVREQVREQVLEEVAQFADTQSYPYHSFFADKIRALVSK